MRILLIAENRCKYLRDEAMIDYPERRDEK